MRALVDLDPDADMMKNRGKIEGCSDVVNISCTNKKSVNDVLNNIIH